MSAEVDGTDLVPPDVFLNATALKRVPGAARSSSAMGVHRKLPGYAPSPLVRCTEIAERLGVGELWVKDESWRLGLPSFKMLGASYATYQAVIDRLGRDVEWEDVDSLTDALRELGPITLAAATDGNHGRAVARMAKLLGYRASIYVPEGMTEPRIRAIESEGASVTVVAGDYDAAVARAALDADDNCLVISDTSWPGYETTPKRVIEGYSTLFMEVSRQLAAAGADEPDLVVVPIGVGALASATVNYYKPESGSGRTPLIVGVEPATANCVMASMRAGRVVTVPGPHESIMVGLNCGRPSLVAWPLLSRGLDAIMAIGDEWARRAMRDLADAGVVAGETGAASLAGLAALCDPGQRSALSAGMQLNSRTSVLVLSTEGATDPQAWRRIVGRPVPESLHRDGR